MNLARPERPRSASWWWPHAARASSRLPGQSRPRLSHGRLALSAIPALLFLLAACSDSGPASPKGPDDPTPKLLRIFPSSISLPLGDRYIFEVRFEDVPQQAVRWTATGGTVVANGDTVTYTAPMQPGTYTLTATGVTDATAKGSATVVVEAPSTGPSVGPSGPDLIDQALAAGQLDVSTATRYKAYWAFRDSRLPAQFAGAPGAGASAHPPPEIYDPPAGVSAEARAELRRYSLPPTDPDSWFQIQWREENGSNAAVVASSAPDQGGGEAIAADNLVDGAFQLLGYDPVVSASGRLRVWWERRRPGDRATAQSLAADLDAAWTLLAANLNNEPWPAYGRPMMDVFLFGLGVNGFVASTVGEASSPVGPCPARGSYMKLNRDQIGRLQGTGTLTHEMLHAFMNAIPAAGSCGEYDWFHEALAMWVETLVTPSRLVEPADIRTRRLREYRNDIPGMPLDEWRGGEHYDGYGAYPFFVYLDREYGRNQVFGAINGTAQGLPFPAINAATGGDFAGRFKDFALQAWGEAPYIQLGQWLGAGAVPRRNEVLLDLEGDKSGLWRDGPPAGRSYLYYLFDAAGAGDPPAKVRIYNPFPRALPADLAGSVGAQLLYRKRGQPWSYEDISTRSGKSFCLDDPEEDYDEFGLIITNAAGQNVTAYENPLAMAWDSCEYSPYWRITEFADTDNLVTDEEIEGSGDLVDMLLRLLANPRSGLFAVRESENDSGTTTWLELRVRKSGEWSNDDCCPIPDATGNEFVQPLGSDPPAPQTVGPFFAGWSSDYWAQSTEDLDTGTMTATQAVGHTTYQIRNGGSQRGPMGGFQLQASRDGLVMTGHLGVTVWWVDDESGEVEEPGEMFRFSFKATRLEKER